MNRRAKLQEDTHFRVLRLLQKNPDLTQRELADKLGISVGGLNYCLKAMMEKGLVKMRNFAQSKNKFGYIYVLTPAGVAEKAAITHEFLQRKMEEYKTLRAEIQDLRKENENIRSDPVGARIDCHGRFTSDSSDLTTQIFRRLQASR